MSDEILTGANSESTDHSVADLPKGLPGQDGVPKGTFVRRENRLLRDPLGLRINHERLST
jgi:hypothetical protein